jgi:hypothetical protein
LLAEIDVSDVPMAFEKKQRDLAKDLAARLLVYTTEVHTAAGHHVKNYWSWRLWASSRGIKPAQDGAAAAESFAAIAAGWPPLGRSKLLPW